jgi:large conductance mechanosensitive channel
LRRRDGPAQNRPCEGVQGVPAAGESRRAGGRRRHRRRVRRAHRAFVQDLITPLIAAIGGQQDFSALTFTINDSVFRYGHFLNQLISFLIIAAVVYFLVVKPVNALMARRKTEEPVDETVRECPECLSSIPAAARRCAFCTTELRAV